VLFCTVSQASFDTSIGSGRAPVPRRPLTPRAKKRLRRPAESDRVSFLGSRQGLWIPEARYSAWRKGWFRSVSVSLVVTLQLVLRYHLRIMDNILQGSLKHFGVSELLHFLIGGKKTGTLNLTDEGKSTWIYVSEGNLVYVFSNQEQFRLGTLMQRRKKISKAQRQQLDDLMLKEGEKFTHAALAQKLFKPDQLGDFLKTQTSEILFDVMSWSNGSFSMTETVNAPSLAVPLNIDLQAVMAEGEMKKEEWQRCLAKLPDTNTVFRVIGDPEHQGKITLSVDQWKVLFKVDGERTLDDLVREADEDPIEV
jgi:hypothetical protein